MSPATNEERIGVLEASLVDVRSDVHDIRKDIGMIRDKLAGRPSWSVSVVITILSSSSVGLLVALANNLS
jgi:hypothetical protein